jgi:hypothetical protein
MNACQLKVLDQRGKTMHEWQVNPWQTGRNEFSLDVGHWAAGLYYMQCQQNGVATTQKVVIH